MSMKNRKGFSLSLLLALLPLAALAQQAPPGMVAGKIIDYPACTHTSFAIDGGDPIAGLATSTPNELLHNSLPDKITRKLRGVVLIQVQIDSTGTTCVPRIQNFTASDNDVVRALAFDQVISRASWQFHQKPGPRTGKVAASSITLKVTFAGRDGYTADYLRMGKFRLATSKP